jgi:drug/metabolite transporter (DMT)-like permease
MSQSTPITQRRKTLSSTRTRRLQKQTGITVSSKLDVIAEAKSSGALFYKAQLAVCSIIYASTYIITKYFHDFMTSEMINFTRFAFAALLFLKDIINSIKNWDIIKIGIELGLWCGIGFGFQTASLKVGSASKAAIFTTVGVVVPPLLDLLFDRKKTAHQKEPLTMKTIMESPFFAPLLTLIGIVIIEWGGLDPPALSDLLLIIPPFCFAMLFYRSEKTAAKHPQATGAITGWMLLVTALTSAITGILFQTFPLQSSDWMKLANIIRTDWKMAILFLYLSFIASGWTSVCEQQALKVLAASDTVLIYTLEPVFASVFSWFFLQEHIGWNTIIGASFILSACLIH